MKQIKLMLFIIIFSNLFNVFAQMESFNNKSEKIFAYDSDNNINCMDQKFKDEKVPFYIHKRTKDGLFIIQCIENKPPKPTNNDLAKFTPTPVDVESQILGEKFIDKFYEDKHKEDLCNDNIIFQKK